MKKKSLIMICAICIICVASLICGVACKKTGEQTFENGLTITIPTNVAIYDNLLTWEHDIKNTGYIVEIDGVRAPVDLPPYELNSAAGTHSAIVFAINGDRISEASEKVSFTVEEFTKVEFNGLYALTQSDGISDGVIKLSGSVGRHYAIDLSAETNLNINSLFVVSEKINKLTIKGNAKSQYKNLNIEISARTTPLVLQFENMNIVGQAKIENVIYSTGAVGAVILNSIAGKSMLTSGYVAKPGENGSKAPLIGQTSESGGVGENGKAGIRLSNVAFILKAPLYVNGSSGGRGGNGGDCEALVGKAGNGGVGGSGGFGIEGDKILYYSYEQTAKLIANGGSGGRGGNGGAGSNSRGGTTGKSGLSSTSKQINMNALETLLPLMATPQGFIVAGNFAVWEETPGATTYCVNINGIITFTTEAKYKIPEDILIGDFEIKVSTLGNGTTYYDSDYTDTYVNCSTAQHFVVNSQAEFNEICKDGIVEIENEILEINCNITSEKAINIPANVTKIIVNNSELNSSLIFLPHAEAMILELYNSKIFGLDNQSAISCSQGNSGIPFLTIASYGDNNEIKAGKNTVNGADGVATFAPNGAGGNVGYCSIDIDKVGIMGNGNITIQGGTGSNGGKGRDVEKYLPIPSGDGGIGGVGGIPFSGSMIVVNLQNSKNAKMIGGDGGDGGKGGEGSWVIGIYEGHDGSKGKTGENYAGKSFIVDGFLNKVA